MLARKLLEAAGNAGGGSLYVDDVFSTYLYTGNNSTQTITNGIDFSGDGGLVWLKNRTQDYTNNVLLDTERGGGKFLYANTADTELDFTGVFGVTFNNNGFTLLDTNSSSRYNTSGETAVSWSFRKAKNFFDVVTYTGNGTAGRTVSHNLGSVPGCVIVKSLGANNWQAYHNGLTSAAYSIWLNSTSAEVSSTVWNSTAPTSTVFTVGSSGLVNNSGTSYVAYVFASDAGGFGADGSESIIKCGSYTGNGSADGPEIDCGFEPQWLLTKGANASNWNILDTARGFLSHSYTGNFIGDRRLQANSTNSEGSFGAFTYLATLLTNGFKPVTTSADYNSSSTTYIYIAIRRPEKPPTAATEVFAPITYTGDGVSGVDRTVGTPGFLQDLLYIINRSTGALASNYGHLATRLRGIISYKVIPSGSIYPYPALRTMNDGIEQSGYGITDSNNQSFAVQHNAGALNLDTNLYIAWAFKRAHGFFDIVNYKTASRTVHTFNHNLAVVPEMMIVKGATAGVPWGVYHKDLGNTSRMVLSSTAAVATDTDIWNSTTPTATQFTIGASVYSSGVNYDYLMFLFASLAGISKVGSYTGTAATINVDCGFSAGARFVLIKRTDSTGDWYVWDSARGIVAGNDPYLLWNSTAAEVTSTDYIDPLSSGFTVTSSAPAGLNASGGTYIFLAIA